MKIRQFLVSTATVLFQPAVFAARNVATTSERILEVMDSLTGQYEKLVRG